jgi:hypothetical protein
MKANHTPSEWRIGDAGNTIFGPKSDSPSPVVVAYVGTAGGNLAAKRANAHILAAAPELLEALIAVYDDWATLSGIDHGEGDEYEDVRNIDAIARAAIAKATGEA